MAFTFDKALPQPLDRIRQLIGDTDPKHPEIDDETIEAYLSTDPVELSVAWRLAEDLAAKYSRIAQVTVDHQSTYGQQIAASYRLLADRLLAQLRMAGSGATQDQSGIFVGGLGDTCGPYDVWTLPPGPQVRP